MLMCSNRQKVSERKPKKIFCLGNLWSIYSFVLSLLFFFFIYFFFFLQPVRTVDEEEGKKVIQKSVFPAALSNKLPVPYSN